MSIGADPQFTLIDYFARHGGTNHVLIANIFGDEIEFFVRPENSTEEEGMHFRVGRNGHIIEAGMWHGG